MAFGWYLNMEPIALCAARDNARMMTDSNYLPEENGFLEATHYPGNEIPDDEAFLSNLKYGFIVVVLLISYFESCLNSILREKCGYSPQNSVMRASHEIKLEIIFLGMNEEYESIKRTHYWKSLNDVRKVRNDLIHYKNSCSNTMASWPPLYGWKIGGQIVGSFFVKSNFERIVNDIENLVKQIASNLDLEIHADVGAIATDASGRPVSYLTKPYDFEDYSYVYDDCDMHNGLTGAL